MRIFFPLVLIELYLILTLILYSFGPVGFEGHNKDIFWILMFLYHVSFILGYCLSVSSCQVSHQVSPVAYSSFLFYLSLFLGLFGVLLSYKNLMLSPSIIPFNIFEELRRGAFEPGLVYTERMQAMSSGSAQLNSRALNIVSILFAFSKLFFIFISIYYWSLLNFFKKIIVCIYSFIFLAPGIASGTNSVIFIFFIFLVFSLAVVFFIKNRRYFYAFIATGVILLLAPVGGFGYIMSQRGGDFSNIASVSPLGDISVMMQTPQLDGFLGFYQYSFVWLNYYLVQGYYGFSLILNMDLSWTFGFGNSAFLQRQLLLLTGVDVSSQTFQARIDSAWDETAQWHSFYGHFANDFGFVGLALLMLALGFYIARVWLSVIYRKSFYGAALIPVLMLMVIFIPANNQVFGYIDTFSYFIFINIFWLFEGKKITWRGLCLKRKSC